MGYALLSRYRPQLMGAAMLWVMLFHASGLDLGVPALNALRAAGFGGVDIFILLSTMGLSMSLHRTPRDYSAFMARRGRRLLPAYFAVMLPYTLYLILAQGAPWAALLWNSTLLYYWLRSAGAFNWYVAGAMAFYSITPWCWRRWSRCGRPVALTAGAVAAGLALCQLLIREGYWYVMDVFYRLPVFFLGLLIGRFLVEGRPFRRGDAWFWLCSALAGAGYAWVSVSCPWVDWPIRFPLCHLFLFTTVPLCLVLAWALDRLPLGWLSRGLAFVGQNSLEIYLLNVSFFFRPELFPAWIPVPANCPLHTLILIPVNIALGALLHRGVAALLAAVPKLRRN